MRGSIFPVTRITITIFGDGPAAMFSTDNLIYAGFIGLTIFIAYWQHRKRAKMEHESRKAIAENEKAGTNEPPSLHPVIDVNLCIGCGSCVAACPEMPLHSPLGLINGKAVLIEASHCIGHGACKTACPTNAISLVFGTEKRGVDIPHVRPNFETNVPGIFIAGELGGMGLIGNAIEQGRQAVEYIKKLDGLGRPDRVDVFIVGAGPAGFAASLNCVAQKLKFITIEQDDLGGTVAKFPRGKIVMTRPVNLPLVGKVKFVETTKEKLLEFWQKVERDHPIKIKYSERLENVTKDGDGFAIKTTKGEYKSRAVLLCLGRGGTPRKLEVPGEDDNKVVYRLIDPAQYAGKSVLVVGGGDSALEAAHSIADEKGSKVILSYRDKAFTRAKDKNKKKVEAAQKAGRLMVMFESKVKAVHPTEVDIEWQGKMKRYPNDAIIVCAGGILPTGFLKSIGVEVETKKGTA